jgi:hypothetical protein
MKTAIKLTLVASAVALLTACGGGGGGGATVGSGGESTQNTVITVPLQVALKNIYATNWSASGTITVLTWAPGGCLGGTFCTSEVIGNFTRTTEVSGLNATVNYAQSIITLGKTRGRNVRYTTSFSSDYSKMNFGSCQTTIPLKVSVGYEKVECVTMTVTAANSPNIATLKITSYLGTETYLIASNGSVSPVSTEEVTAAIFSDLPFVDYTLKMIF